MKHISVPFLLVVALACGSVDAAQPSQRVYSEPSRTTKTTPAPRFRAASHPRASISSLQFGEMSVARIHEVQVRNNSARELKATQIGIARTTAQEGRQATLPALRWLKLDGGGHVARVEIRSPDALGLRVGLDVRGLDPRVELRFAGSDAPSRVVAMVRGDEAGRLSDAKHVYWTPATDGETQIIEVFAPVGVPPRSIHLQAPTLSHLLTNSRNDFKILKSIGDSGSCNVDTICRVAELGQKFIDAKNAVAHMVFIVGGNGYICTGTLLNDTAAGTQVPYFYSAHHCIGNQTVASTLNTYWKFEATSCGSGVAAANTLLAGGATYLFSDTNTDGLLLRLNNTPPAGSVYSGWDTAALPASSDVFAIHHPAGDLKKVSQGQKMDADDLNIIVGWTNGTTEGGSSGSGLFTVGASGYLLRGGLYGGSASCANTGSLSNPENRDYYSRFDVMFPHVRQWLSPPTNVAPVANFTHSVNGKIISFTDTSTDSDGTIASRSWAFGDGTTSTAANPAKTYASLGVYNVTLTVTDNGGLSHSITRSVSTIGRGRRNGSQPRVHGAAAPVPQPATKTRNTRQPSRTVPLER